MKYDLFHLINSDWEPSDQIVAPSRRMAMRILRMNNDYSAKAIPTGVDEIGKLRWRNGGAMNGRYKVRLAVE